MYLTLPLFSVNTTRCHLLDCLNSFLRPEEMKGESKWKCPNCKDYREATKKIDIWRLPPLLIIHLKRFNYSGMWRNKLTTKVDYPIDNLNLDDFVLNNNNKMSEKSKNSYHLYAISNHLGTMDGGHYTAMCRHTDNNRWYRFDDTLVKEIKDLSELQTPTSYILFYSK
jgi:ubiquitin carboxyl-terminal hydrolase 8